MIVMHHNLLSLKADEAAHVGKVQAAEEGRGLPPRRYRERRGTLRGALKGGGGQKGGREGGREEGAVEGAGERRRRQLRGRKRGAPSLCPSVRRARWEGVRAGRA